MMPIEGGNYRWSREAFGDMAGFQAGWWSWLAGVVVSASYAALFTKYLDAWVPPATDPAFARWAQWGLVALDPATQATTLSWGARWAVCLTLIWVVHLLNSRGIDLVGDSAVLLSALLLVPFVIMTWHGAMNWRVSPFVPFTAPGKGWFDYSVALAAVFWLYSGYDKLSAAAEEVDNPQRTFPPALLTAAGLATISCVVPTLFAEAELGNWQEWTDGYFPTACLKMVGPWLKNWMIVGGLISNALLLVVTMLSTSRVLLCMAADGFVSKRLASIHPEHDTPTGSLLAGSLVLSVLTVFSFTQLLIIYVWLQMFTNMMIFVNAYAMRSSHPEMPRPFKVPGGRFGLVLLALPTVFLAVVAMTSAVFPDATFSPPQFAIAVIAALSGFGVYALRPRAAASE